MININLIGSIHCTKAVVPGMKARGSGHIVLTSSLAGLLGIFGYTAYSASKFAVRGLAESLYMEVKFFHAYLFTDKIDLLLCR